MRKRSSPFFVPTAGEELAEVDTTCRQVCKTSMFYCPQCRKSVARENNICPYCGTEIKGKVA